MPNEGISSSWPLLSISDICLKIHSGGTPSRSKPEYYGGDIPWLKTQELNDARIYSSQEFISEEGLVNSSAKLFPIGTVLIAMYGATVGKLGMLSAPAATNQAACGLIADPDVADPRFLFYALMADRERLVHLANGAAQQNLSAETIKKFHLAIPRLDAQRRIAAVLTALDDKIEANTKLAHTADELASALLDDLLSAPHEVRVLSELAHVNPDRAPRAKGVFQYIDISTVGDGTLGPISWIDWSDAPSRASRGVKPFDILWSTVRPNRRAHVMLSEAHEKCVASTGFAVLRAHSVSPAYLYQVTSRDEFAQYLISEATGSAYPAVNAKAFAQAPIAVLSPEKMVEFDAIAEPLRAMSIDLTQESIRLAKLRDYLLPRLMSGKVTIKEAQESIP